MTVNTGLILLPGHRTTPEFLERLESVVNASENPVIYLAIDPGKANGICGYDTRFYLQFMMTVQADDMIMFLEQFKKLEVIICEDYKILYHKTKDHAFSDLETTRVIGRIEGYATRLKVKLVKQLATIKKTGYAFIGKTPLPKSDPTNHQLDAHVHFIFWAVKNQLIDIKTLLRN